MFAYLTVIIGTIGKPRMTAGAAAPPTLSWRLPVLLAAGVMAAGLIRGLVFEHTIISGPSMAPTFRDGDSCLVRRTLAGDVARGEVVIVEDGVSRSIKRVIGLPNESLLFKDGKVYVNGRALRETYLGSAGQTYPVFKTRFTLGREDYFVMGDNRGQSEDSRVYGPLGKNSIVGKVDLR
jgi:signal peptidase I